MHPDSYRTVFISGLTLLGERVQNSTRSRCSNEEEWFNDILCIMGKFEPQVSVDIVAWVDIDTHEAGMKKRTDEGWIEANDEVFKDRFFF